jgi:hypothetical protein
MAAAMRSLKTLEICFSVPAVESTIVYHIEIAQKIPGRGSMLACEARSGTGVRFVLQNQGADSRR